MQLDFLPQPSPRAAVSSAEFVDMDGRRVPILYQRNERARRYRLSVDREGHPRVTIPRRGNIAEAQSFVGIHQRWLVERLRRHAALPDRRRPWLAGTEVYFRGQPTQLEVAVGDAGWLSLRLGEFSFSLAFSATETMPDLRPLVERRLRVLAEEELPSRVLELAAPDQSPFRRVAVRAQISRWGSCSRLGTISLNWRLVQVPPAVRDYVIVHELMHLQQMNHSARFWALVRLACPDYELHESWLRAHGRSIL